MFLKITEQLIAAARDKNYEGAKQACVKIRESILRMTPTVLASALGVTRQTIHEWEKTGRIPLRRAEELKKLVESQGGDSHTIVRGQAESLTAGQVLERITRCSEVWIMKGATAFQSGLFDVVEKKLVTCLLQNEQLVIRYVFPDFKNYKRSHNAPLRSFLRFRSELTKDHPGLVARVRAYPVTSPEDAFPLCISASPAGLIILEYKDNTDGPPRELIVELWDGEEHEILRKLSDLYASYIYEGITPFLNKLEKQSGGNGPDINEKEAAGLLEMPRTYSYPRLIDHESEE